MVPNTTNSMISNDHNTAPYAIAFSRAHCSKKIVPSLEISVVTI